MARRYFAEGSVSQLAVWARRLALFALVVATLSIIIVRSGLLEILPALATFAAALMFAAIAGLLAILSFFGIWRRGLAGLGYAMVALLLASMLLAYPTYLGVRAYRLPPISDITTDPGNPPRFDVIARLRPRGRIEYPGAATAEKQRAAYPDITTLELGAPAQVAYDVALAVVTRRKWRVVDARGPAAGRREGIIEAVARTPIMGFRDDVVIRVTAAGQVSRVDIRSASRYGRHDFGTNAARIRSLMEDIDDAIGSLPVAKQPEPPKPPQAGAKRPPARR